MQTLFEATMKRKQQLEEDAAACRQQDELSLDADTGGLAGEQDRRIEQNQ